MTALDMPFDKAAQADDPCCYSAIAQIIRGLATNVATSDGADSELVVTVADLPLPGPDTPAKSELERELLALTSRLRHLEARASTFNNRVFPDTPNEQDHESAIFSSDADPSLQGSSRLATRPKPSSLSQERGASLLSTIMSSGAGRDGGGCLATPLDEDEMRFLLGHVKGQEDRITNLKRELGSVNKNLLDQQTHTQAALDVFEADRVRHMERELKKHVQTNEAFQKVLREIGNIITAVANGDLSKKVQVHATELDPEIATFKGTINTMMDQLQVFASEVSRVAREVGTEGRLGGQAQITGMDGVWRELTTNGE